MLDICFVRRELLGYQVNFALSLEAKYGNCHMFIQNRTFGLFVKVSAHHQISTFISDINAVSISMCVVLFLLF